MKKILCVLLAMTAVFCFAGCQDGKCDECKTEENVAVYEVDGKEVEYCQECRVKKGLNDIKDNINDTINGILGGK